MNRKVLYKTLSVLLLLVFWQVIAGIVGADFLLASPFAVLKRLGEVLWEKEFLKTVGFSFLRIGSGFLGAFLLGTLSAIMAARFSVVEYFLWPYVTAVKAVPIASFIILCLIWLDYSMLTVFIAFLISFPVIYSNVLQGMKSADGKLLELASLYQVPYGRRFLFVYLPGVKPFLLSACNVAVGMAWKSGVAAEVIGVVKGSIGERLYDAKIYFLNSDLLAWTIVIIAVSVVSEKLFGFLLRQVFRRIERI